MTTTDRWTTGLRASWRILLATLRGLRGPAHDGLVPRLLRRLGR